MSDFQASAWILEEAQGRPSKTPWEASLGIGLEATGKIGPGVWALVCDKDGRLKSVGRVLRTRQRGCRTSLFFDKGKALDSTIDLQRFGLPFPRKGPVPVRWDEFIGTLSKLGLGDPEEIPLADDVTYLRNLLELSVTDDLLGPADGPDELVIGMSVRERYLVGKLAPLHPAHERSMPEPGAETGNGEPEEAEETEASRHQPGEEFESTSGRVEPEDDALDEIDTTSNQSLVPSSMGFTFCVGSGVDRIDVETSWGCYERVPNDEHDYTAERTNRKTGEKELVKLRVWRRIPCGGRLELPLQDGLVRPKTPDETQPEVVIQGTVRTNSKGEKLVTLFLVNGQVETKENKDTTWLFQPEIVARASETQEESAVFRRRPEMDGTVDDPERDVLSLIYRNHLEFAVGHGVSVHAEPSPIDPEKATEVRTVVVPRYEVPVTETPGLDPEDRPAMKEIVQRGWLDMQTLSEMEKDELGRVLNALVDDYGKWISELGERTGKDVVGFDKPAKEIVGRCREALRRLREGVDVLLADEKSLAAFRFANRAMALQRVHGLFALERRRKGSADLATIDFPANRTWRPFQLAFMLISIPSLANPGHADRTDTAAAFADLLWFPTGGGKTEAYLGLAAFAMAVRRIQGDFGGLDSSRGLSVVMRYTLRLLTLQQFQRAATLLCAMETLRRESPSEWGFEPFTLGLYVGNRVTPGTTAESAQTIEAFRNGDRFRSSFASPAQLTNCPWCGCPIDPGKNIKVDKTLGRTSIFCGDPFGKCAFSERATHDEPLPGLPVKVVDEEIYHRPPSMMIATVDKFAMMAWKPEVRTLFGRVGEECERHGLLWPGHDCPPTNGHPRQGQYAAARVRPVKRIRPPDLIVQDEFHLIGGPLGTLVGLYESAVDELCSWKLDDKTVRPKIVASTATIRRAADQVRNVFMRRVAVFPPSGLDVEDNFFSVQRPLWEKPGRRYMGICAPGTSRPAVLIRTYTAYLTAAQSLFDHFGPIADPYMTLVGYFNSLRELGGMKRLSEDDVRTRSYRVGMSHVARPGLAQRDPREILELTSRISSTDIPKYLDQLEVPFRGVYDGRKDLWEVQREGHKPADVVLATNMLSVGVDVNRLGLMVVNGQPKGTAEYIQATSRVGRSKEGPGVVGTVLTWARPRDLSHYETFEHYHATFYKHVEAQSVTPFSPRALDRGLTGAMVSFMRNAYETFADNEGAGRMDKPGRAEVEALVGAFSERALEVTGDPIKKDQVVKRLKGRADEWSNEAGMDGRVLVYQKNKTDQNSVNLLKKPGASPWNDWTVPMSMREVEASVRLIMEGERTVSEPEWKASSQTEGVDHQ
ncbi:MAG: DISARM system helicase DrmA [Synergistales bacterium]